MNDRRIRAVLFDFDGTLTRPEAIDFGALRARLGVPAGTPILEFIEALPSAEDRARRHRILEGFEEAAARASLPNSAAEDILLLLHERGFRLGILTRNTRSSIDLALGNFRRVSHTLFDAIITREHQGRPKPYPDGVYAAARLLGVDPRELLVVGDFIFDIAAGRAAGSPTVLITNTTGRDAADKAAADARARIGGEAPHLDAAPDHVISSLDQLRPILGL